jgi:hypothetical protein
MLQLLIRPTSAGYVVDSDLISAGPCLPTRPGRFSNGTNDAFPGYAWCVPAESSPPLPFSILLLALL